MDDAMTAELGSDLAAVVEGSVAAAREIEALLTERAIPVRLAAKEAAACCGGGCGCGTKLRVMVNAADVPRVRQLLDEAWLDSVRREGVIDDRGLVALRSSPAAPDAQAEACPACGYGGARQAGACGDCGLQLE
jgi:hypothetical protein